MRLRYQILQGRQVLAQGMGHDIPYLDASLVIVAEQTFERVTGLRLHLLEDAEDGADPPRKNLTVEDPHKDDFTSSLRSTLAGTEVPVIIASPLFENPSPPPSPEQFGGGESGGAGASANYDSHMSDSGSLPDSSSSYDSGSGSSGSNE